MDTEIFPLPIWDKRTLARAPESQNVEENERQQRYRIHLYLSLSTIEIQKQNATPCVHIQ